MLTEDHEQHLAKILHAAQSLPGPGLEARAMAAMTHAISHRPRWPLRRLAVAAAGAAVVLALGFVPFPLGTAEGALRRAMATAAQASTVHITGHTRGWKHDFDLEEWVSEDGFSRREEWKGRQLAHLVLIRGDWVLTYDISDEDGSVYAYERFDPTKRHRRSMVMPDRSYLLGSLESFRGLAEQLDIAAPDMKITERRQRSLYGGLVDVVEAEFSLEGGTLTRIRAEIDPNTDHILSMTRHKFEGTWQPTHQAHYEWDVEVPEDARDFRPPEGTTLTRFTWWETRADRVVASGATPDWKVALHAIDVNRTGDLVLSLSRVLAPDSRISPWFITSATIRVEALGSSGERYRQLKRFGCYNAFDASYFITTLEREQPGGDPQTVTLVIYPYPKGESEGQSVTFSHLSLPPRQDVADLVQAETEKIHY